MSHTFGGCEQYWGTVSTAEESGPSRRLVEQRVRNRIIEYLTVVSSFEEQRQYQVAAPLVHVPTEMINQWEDWVLGDPRTYELADVYSEAEVRAVRCFHEVWDRVAATTQDPLPPLPEAQKLPEWDELRRAGLEALEAFMRRGSMPENVED